MSKKKTEKKDDYFVTTKDIVEVLDTKPDLVDPARDKQPNPKQNRKPLINRARLNRWREALRDAVRSLRFRIVRTLKRNSIWTRVKRLPNRMQLLGIVGVSLGLVGILFLWLMFSAEPPDSSEVDSDKIESTASQPSLSPRTIAELRREVKQDPKNAEARLFLGHALFSARKRDKALRFYKKALQLDATIQDNQLVNNLVKSFGTKGQDRAARLITKHKITNAQEGLRNILRHKRRAVRTKALKTLTQLGKATRTDRVEIFLLDLQAKECAVRKRAVTKLGILGDKKAILALQQAAKKDQDETPWYSSSCLGHTVEDAIQKIRAKRK